MNLKAVDLSASVEKRPLPPGWRWVRLGDVCKVVSGSTPKSGIKEFWDGEIVWITPTDLGQLAGSYINSSARRITKAGYDSCGTELVLPGSVVLSSRAPIGHLGIATVPLCTNQGCKSFIPRNEVYSRFLYFALKKSVSSLQEMGSGAIFAEVSKSQVEGFEIPLPPLSEQKRIAAILTEQMAAMERARTAAEAQFEATKMLPAAYLRESFATGLRQRIPLSRCLIEVSKGVGPSWSKYRLVGATRAGIAPAKEGIGKTPERYKLVDAGTIFYNPMRILLGSIAMVDEGDEAGITSPDYVVFKTKSGVLHPRWFYYWLRSPDGDVFIKTLTRGAVRERMLFRRLAEAEVELPQWKAQVEASEKMKEIRNTWLLIKQQLETINKLPVALLRRAFNGKL